MGNRGEEPVDMHVKGREQKGYSQYDCVGEVLVVEQKKSIERRERYSQSPLTRQSSIIRKGSHELQGTCGEVTLSVAFVSRT